MSQRLLAEAEARLAQAEDFNEAELRSQALAQAADDRKMRLNTSESGSDRTVYARSSMYFILLK